MAKRKQKVDLQVLFNKEPTPGFAKKMRVSMQPSVQSRTWQKGSLPPHILADALQEKAHVDIGVGRPAKSVKVTAKQAEKHEKTAKVVRNKLHHWNFRIVVSESCGEDFFTIRECWYENDSKKPVSWTDDEGMAPGSETLDGLKWEIERYMEAFQKPIWREIKDKNGNERLVPWKPKS